MTTFNNGLQLISKHKGATAAIVGGSAIAIGAGTALALARVKKRSKKGKRTSKRKTRRNGKQRQPHTAGKRRDRSHKRIRYTKKNQPYIIQANGRAKFISKKSARVSRRRRGGRY